MPWIDQSMCVGCGVCERKCPAGAVVVNVRRKADIDQAECIRCGICHEVCPRDAVRHDSELVPKEVAANLAWVEKLKMHPYYAGKPELLKQLHGRLKKHFAKTTAVAQQTLDALG